MPRGKALKKSEGGYIPGYIGHIREYFGNKVLGVLSQESIHIFPYDLYGELRARNRNHLNIWVQDLSSLVK